MSQGPRANACDTDGIYRRARSLPENIRVKEAAPAYEVLLGDYEVAAIVAHLHLGIACEPKACRAALALGEAEYPVRQQLE